MTNTEKGRLAESLLQGIRTGRAGLPLSEAIGRSLAADKVPFRKARARLGPSLRKKCWRGATAGCRNKPGRPFGTYKVSEAELTEAPIAESKTGVGNKGIATTSCSRPNN